MSTVREMSDAEREAWEAIAEAEQRLEDARLRFTATVEHEARKRHAHAYLRVVEH